MWDGDFVVDANSHILEPPDLWLAYIDPEFRENCLRVERDPATGDQLIVNGRRSDLIPRLAVWRGVLTSQSAREVDTSAPYARAHFAAYNR